MSKERLVASVGNPLEWVDVPDIDELVTPANIANVAAQLPIGGALPEPFNALVDQSNRYHSFSGCDIIVQAYSDGKLKKFAELQTFSFSVHREKNPVRTLGRSNPKGFTRGARTIAGSMVFTVFDRNALWELVPSINRNDPPDIAGHSTLIDQIPPIDITITFQNEVGVMSSMRLYGLEMVNEGQTMSIDDIFTENVTSYLARDMTIMAPNGLEFGPDGKTFINQGIFFSDYTSQLNIELAVSILRKIGQVETSLATASGATRSSLLSELALLNSQLEDLSKNSYNIPKEGTLDKTGPYYTPWSYLDIR